MSTINDIKKKTKSGEKSAFIAEAIRSYAKNESQENLIKRMIEGYQATNELSQEDQDWLTLAAKIGQTPIDSDFAKFGIKISKMDKVDAKKITKRELWAQNNIFIHNRILFGCNWRADIISTIEIGAENPTEVKNRLKCSYETAHRVFNDYRIIQEIKGAVA